jgi:hypothetical protein
MLDLDLLQDFIHLIMVVFMMSQFTDDHYAAAPQNQYTYQTIPAPPIALM